jgi:endonuclease YncB( thermonuclease family)
VGRRRWQRGQLGSLALLLIIAALIVRPWEAGDRAGEGPAAVDAYVIRAVDGDTIEARVDGRDEYVRYIGVDTPETVKPNTPVQCFGPRASRFNHRLVDGRRVRLVFGVERRDIYGRLLAYVHLGHRFVNAILARRGLARPLTIAPNDRYAPLFQLLSLRAARAGRGLWGTC